jgi:hypothetical protein
MSGLGWSTLRGVVRPTDPPVMLLGGDTPLTPRGRGFAPLDSREYGRLAQCKGTSDRMTI